MDFNTVKQLLEELLCESKKVTKDELIQGIDSAVDALESIQRQYVLLDRSVIKETR